MNYFKMGDKKRVSTTFTNHSSAYSPYISSIMEHCEKLFPLNDTKPIFNDLSRVPESVRPIFEPIPVSSRPKNVDECMSFFLNLVVSTNSNFTQGNLPSLLDIPKHPTPLIIFVTLIAIVSVISVTGNLCLAKVLYSKRFRLVQTDRIVLCLALSKHFVSC